MPDGAASLVGPPGTFLVGANLPWVGYGTDIGASAWYPAGGLSTRSDARDRLDAALAIIARDGLSLVRVFLLCDGRSGIRTEAGLPAGLDDSALADVEALLAAAGRVGVRLMPVLFDFHLCRPAGFLNGVQTGGRAAWLSDPAARAALVERVIAPLVSGCGDDARIAAWDVMNEPEWCVQRPGRLRRGIPFRAMQGFLRDAVHAVRAGAAQPVTIGSATIRGLELVRPLALDVYQVHWYERFGWHALRRPVEDLALDAPIILGEFPGAATRWTPGEIVDAARDAGYRGALVWSLLAEDDQSAWPAF